MSIGVIYVSSIISYLVIELGGKARDDRRILGLLKKLRSNKRLENLNRQDHVTNNLYVKDLLGQADAIPESTIFRNILPKPFPEGGQSLRSTRPPIRNLQDSESPLPHKNFVLICATDPRFFKLIISLSFKMSEEQKGEVCVLSGGLAISREPSFEVTWRAVDKENPRTWPVWYRCFVVAATSFSTTIVYVCFYHERQYHTKNSH